MSLDQKDRLEHAWRYFQLHASQRITVFNFFVATSGLLVAALVFALRGGAATSPLSIAAGLGLSSLSFVFWKLDGRVSDMIKVSEAVIMQVEEKCIDEASHRVMCEEREFSKGTKFRWFGKWTYGQAFRRIFFVLGAAGVLGAAVGACQLWRGEPQHTAKDAEKIHKLLDAKSNKENTDGNSVSGSNTKRAPIH